MDARPGEAALLKFREFLPDLVLLDLNMPFVYGELEIDFDTQKVRFGGKQVRLTPKEFELLRYLVAHAGKPVPHRELLQAVWGLDYGDQSDYLRVFITHLRKKLETDPAHPKYILTEPWVCYRFA